MATRADRLGQAWLKLSQHLASHPACARSYRDRREMACGEGQELYRGYLYELGVEHEARAREPVSTDELIEVHQRLQGLESIDELLHGGGEEPLG